MHNSKPVKRLVDINNQLEIQAILGKLFMLVQIGLFGGVEYCLSKRWEYLSKFIER